ncbi:MAG: DNA-directed RNA polymerase subunit alpha [Clostridia bacterium]|nr:DNA-directed RNA polymerase subunit alpha [Clostridia bacterium]
MIEIKKPQIDTEESKDGSRGKFTVEPLERGLGTTLGNALRRILLGAMPGTAAVGIKIDGVQHEFSTIPNVVEDVVEIILNIKKIAFKALSPIDNENKPVVRLQKFTAGPVYARDIECGLELEILNPDQYICSIDEGGSVNMELTIGSGRGYVTADKNKDPRQPIGYIPIDSIYTPVVATNYTVEDTRIGQSLDYDKLVVELTTDGTTSAREVISLAAKILEDHAKLFVDLSSDMDKVSVLVNQEEDTQQRVLEMTIEDLDLSVRSYNCLKRAGIHTVEDLTKKSSDEMLKVRNLGKKSLDEVIKKLEDLGLSLKNNDE